jgi:hypothetical protein
LERRTVNWDYNVFTGPPFGYATVLCIWKGEQYTGNGKGMLRLKRHLINKQLHDPGNVDTLMVDHSRLAHTSD